MIIARIVSRTRRCSYLFKNRKPNLTFPCPGCFITDDTKTDNETISLNEMKKEDKADEYPEEPTTCCMSGCPNCVWLDYAQKLSDHYKDGGDEALKQIEEKVADPNMKAFLLHELRMRRNLD